MPPSESPVFLKNTFHRSTTVEEISRVFWLEDSAPGPKSVSKLTRYLAKAEVSRKLPKMENFRNF
jgi:hypothetical protein